MPDTEKISFNISVVDLGKIDLLVNQGFYSGRTDLIRTALRNLLASHGDVVQESVSQRSMVVGAVIYGRHTLEKAKAEGKTLDLKVVGLLSLAGEVDPDLALATISSIQVFGAFRARDDVKAALADRIR